MSLAIAIVLGAAVIVLLATALLALSQIARGPSQLDRIVAADLLVAVVIAGVGAWVVATKQTTEVGMLLVLSMLGFTGAVSVARMVGDRLVSRRRHAETRNRKEPTS